MKFSACLLAVFPASLALVVSASAQGDAALLTAVGQGNVEAVQRLLDNKAGVDGDITYVTDERPITLAAADGNIKIVELLLAHGADAEAPNGRELNALHLASESGNEDMVRLLLSNQASPNAMSTVGFNALHAAAAAGQTNIVKILLAAGADANARTQPSRSGLERFSLGDTPLHSAISGDRFGSHNVPSSEKAKIVNLLLRAGADPNITNEDGATPLQLAGGGSRGIVEELLNAKADVNLGNPLLNVCDETIAELLLQKGANIRAKTDDGSTLLHHAAADCPDLVRLFLSRGLDAGSKTFDGTTPLLVAVRRNAGADVVKLLLDGSADPNASDAHGETPMSLARRSGDQALIRLLEKYQRPASR